MCFWYKRPLKDFLTACGVPVPDLDPLDSETKVEFFRALAARYQMSESGQDVLYRIASRLAKMKHFPGLDGDSDLEAAKRYVALLAECLDDSEQRHADAARLIDETPVAATAVLRSSLPERYQSLLMRVGEREAGIEFESLVCDLARVDGVEVKEPYRAGGRQFDGSVEVDGKVYLLECKLRKTKSDSKDISDLRDKVLGTADLTQGIFVSIGGYTSCAIDNASRAKSPLVLLDFQHVSALVTGVVGFSTLVRVCKRHASETGCAFLPWPDVSTRLSS